jgi:transitional endoplasmic reticulum ATPase
MKVVENVKKDINKMIVRISSQQMKAMNLRIGDVALVENKIGKIPARVMPIHLTKYSKMRNVIQPSNIIKNNLDLNIDDKVVVEKQKTKIAQTLNIKILENNNKNKKFILNLIKKVLINNPTLKGNKFKIYDGIEFLVKETKPKGIVVTNKKTNIIIVKKKNNNQKYIKKNKAKKNIKFDKNKKDINLTLSYQEIGGLKEEITKVRELVEIPFKFKELFKKIGIDPPKGILLYGPPGTGKTLIARVIAQETDAHFLHISGPEIMSKYYGESEAKIRDIFNEAREHTPSIIFLDEIDAIASKREVLRGEMEKRVVSQLLALLDGLEERREIVVIGATNIPESLDSALRRPGRFDREISIGIPDKRARKEILKIHSRKLPLHDDVDLNSVSTACQGFVGADLEVLCKEAAMKALHRTIPSIAKDKNEVEITEEIEVRKCDFNQALQEIQPSIIREVVVEIPEVKWSNVGGLEKIKEKLQKNVEWFFSYSEYFNKTNFSLPKGIMLEGPPGVGKTLLVKALANKIKANFISIKGPELLSKWVGESEKGVRKLFAKAKQAAPCILFFDEIDALVPSRGKGNNEVVDRVVSQFLTELDGIQELVNVIIIGATNRLDIIDKALLRPGRFDSVFKFPLPNLKARFDILQIHTEGLNVSEVNLKNIALKTKGVSGADLAALCRKATFNALEREIQDNKINNSNIQKIKLIYGDFKNALCDIRRENKLL